MSVALLRYVGPDPAVVGVVPLPEGWPALDHEEPDEAVAAEKMASGKYRAARAPKGATAAEGEE